MKRKVAKIGSSTLMVSLPSKWCRANNVGKGDEVEVMEEGGKLTIILGKIKKDKEAVITLAPREEFSRRLLYLPYINGYDSIKVYFSKKEELDIIRKTAENMLGFELVEQGEGYCIIKNIAEGIESEFETISKRLMNMVIAFGDDLCDILNKGELERLNTLIELDKLANKLTRFSKRMINKNFHREKAAISYRVHCLLEEIMDNYREICKEFIKQPKIKVHKQLLDCFNEIKILVQLFRHLYFKFDMSNFLRFRERERLFKNKIQKLFSITNKEEWVIIAYIVCISDKLHHLVEDLY